MDKPTRICSRCEDEFPLDAKHFYRNRATKNGFHSSCKPCQKERMRETYGMKVGDLKVKASTFRAAKKGRPEALAELKRLNVTAIWNGREMVRL